MYNCKHTFIYILAWTYEIMSFCRGIYEKVLVFIYLSINSTIIQREKRANQEDIFHVLQSPHSHHWQSSEHWASSSSQPLMSLLLNPIRTLSISPLLPSSKAHLFLSPNSKLRSFQSTKNEALPSKTKKKIVLFDVAPPVSEDDNGIVENGRVSEGQRKLGGVPPPPPLGFLRKGLKRVLAALSNLPLAIGEMFTIASLMALGMLSDSCFSFSLNYFLWFWGILICNTVILFHRIHKRGIFCAC